MAKVCSINRNEKRKKMTKRDSAKRAKLKAIIMDRELPPRNGAKNRIRNRCELTGRPRSFHGKFSLSRIMLRKLASEGQLPGVVKSSW